MVSKAIGRFLPVTPRKVRAVVRLMKGLDVPRAQAVLAHLPKRACQPVAKVLNSALANATREGTWGPEQLVISRIQADEGPSGKRFRAAPRGRAAAFRRKMCHLLIELDVRAAPLRGTPLDKNFKAGAKA